MRDWILFALGGAVVTALLYWGAQNIVPLALFLNLFTPMPAAYTHMRFGTLPGGLAVLGACVILAVFFPATMAGGYLLQFGILSFVIPLLLRRGIAWDRTVLLNVCAVMLVAGVLLVGFSVTQEVSPAQVIRQQADLAVAQALEFYDQGQFPAQDRDQFASTLGDMADIFVRIFPALGAVIVAGLSLLTVLLLNSFSGGRYRVPGPEFAAWRSPEFLIWGVIAAGFSMLIDQPLLRTVAMNLLILLLPIYFVQGMAVVNHFLKRRAVSPIIRSLIYFLIFIFNPLPLVVTGVGVFDLWIDFRKPKIKKTS
ncbi:DUF2232 domain-containing protein [Geoalkalibacter subterraneus]|uniref:DUF2232 domain-containing protein n=1 Tax=Geoalkalibacter subterraneus TaxID=483547 RepID=A0A0B5FRF3_9BACT|nr:DUF2232 domain-containing protein [Geoalkalibacter subterraneus]AJF06146.1 hypothetical protein GSUB_05615 [Geoalkalibacter subterraneus]